MESREVSSLKHQAVPVRGEQSFWGLSHISRLQTRIYTGLLVVVAVIGIPMLGIPSLRHRLYTRIHALYEATGPLSSPPIWAKVGENRHPFPAEFERPVVTRSPSALPGMIDLANRVYRPPETLPSPDAPSTPAPESQGLPETTATDDQATPEFRQGKIEQEAYEILLRSNETIAAMVKGSNPSLRFKLWYAAKRSADAFLVDLIFTQVSDNKEVHYIWEVKISSKEVKPESYNARALAKP
jgi:hypothetical protein